MKRVLIAATLVSAAAAFPSWSAAATLKGVVVARSTARSTLAVASARGTVRTLHVARLVRAGSRVAVAATPRADGTFMSSRVAVTGRARHARIRGFVVGRTARHLLLSAGQSMIAVRLSARTAASAADDGHHGDDDVGTEIEIVVGIAANGELEDEDEIVVNKAALVEIEGVVVGVQPGAIQVLPEHGIPVTVTVPPNVDLHVAVGDEIEVKAIVQGTTLILVKAEIEDEHEEDDG